MFGISPPLDGPLLRPGRVDAIPVEILSEIFLLALQGGSWHPMDLMLVCRRWLAITLSTPGIYSDLTIRRATQEEVVQEFIQGRKSRLVVTIDIDDERDGKEFNAENFRACFMAASRAASRWSYLILASPPPHGEYNDLQILQPLYRLEVFHLGSGFDTLVEPLMIAIAKSESTSLTRMDLEDPVAVLYLVQPVCLQITKSLTTLNIYLPNRMDGPVDILSHLQRLEDFHAYRLCLPIYPPDASLPLIHTLRALYLKSVSVQWMAGHVFHALERCEIIFPHHADTMQALQHVSMPTCSFFRYDSNDLQPVTQFQLPSLSDLDVKSGQWNVQRGNLQLATMYPLVVARAHNLSSLRLDVACSEMLLVYMLRHVPALKTLWLGLASPNALGKSFFQAFIVRNPAADCTRDMIVAHSQTAAPLCPSLASLCLDYRRWLRGRDKRALIVILSDIVESRQRETESSFSLRLPFGDMPEERGWTVGKPMRKFQHEGDADLVLGISTSHATIPISANLPKSGLVPLPFKEAEYLKLRFLVRPPPLEFLLIHDHMELILHEPEKTVLPRSQPGDLPLFYGLKVLVLENTHPSCLIGHTFPKLERFRVGYTSRWSDGFLAGETKMPVCTRVDVDDASLLATFKLPQVHELALSFDYTDRNTDWEQLFTVNDNLSRLNLLHMKDWSSYQDLIQVLRSLPSLETLIFCSHNGAVALRALVQIDEIGTSDLKHTEWKGKTLALLCPRLQHVQIEFTDPLVQPNLIPFVKHVVSLRAEHGYSLKSFTLSEFLPESGSRF